MDAQHKAAKIISGLVLLASILLLIDYYLPATNKVLVIESIRTRAEQQTSRRTGYVYQKQFHHAIADGIKIHDANFNCVTLEKGDTVILGRTPIYKLQLSLTVLNGFNSGVICDAEYNPFIFKGLFVLLPIILSAGAMRSKEKGGSIIGAGVALVVLLAVLCPLFIL